MEKRAAPGTPSPKAASQYFDQTLALLEKLKQTQSEVIQQAADLCIERIARGGLIFLFGNGHSRMLCEESFYVVPLYYLPEQWVARWTRIERPAATSLYGYLPETWWRSRTQ